MPQRALRAAAVPEPLRDLLPLAERWGVSADTARHDLAALASDTELEELSTALQDRRQPIEDWLYTSDDESSKEERAAFQAMLVFELEACGGPGVSGLLEWAIRWYLDAPSADRLLRLRAARDEAAAWPRTMHMDRAIKAAQDLIDGAGEVT